MAYWILNQIARWHLKVDEILPYSHETHGRRDSAKNKISSRWFESRVWMFHFDPRMVHWTLWKKRQDSLVTFWTVHTKYANIIPLQLSTTTAFQELRKVPLWPLWFQRYVCPRPRFVSLLSWNKPTVLRTLTREWSIEPCEKKGKTRWSHFGPHILNMQI